LEDDDFDIITAIDGDDLGAFYGFLTAEAGFDYDFGGFVLGILGNYDFNGDDNDAEASAATADDDDNITAINVEAELDDTWFLGARAGFTTGSLFGTGNNTSLIYVLGGYTWADGTVKSQAVTDGPDVPDGVGDFDEDDSVDGWTFGGGIETMLWESISLKLEYRHDFLDDIDVSQQADIDGGDQSEHHDASVDFERDTVRGVLSWRFGSWW
jgi:outer membrane immunogenic protein